MTEDPTQMSPLDALDQLVDEAMSAAEPWMNIQDISTGRTLMEEIHGLIEDARQELKGWEELVSTQADEIDELEKSQRAWY
jgi:hypothetical protein